MSDKIEQNEIIKPNYNLENYERIKEEIQNNSFDKTKEYEAIPLHLR